MCNISELRCVFCGCLLVDAREPREITLQPSGKQAFACSPCCEARYCEGEPHISQPVSAGGKSHAYTRHDIAVGNVPVALRTG